MCVCVCINLEPEVSQVHLIPQPFMVRWTTSKPADQAPEGSDESTISRFPQSTSESDSAFIRWFLALCFSLRGKPGSKSLPICKNSSQNESDLFLKLIYYCIFYYFCKNQRVTNSVWRCLTLCVIQAKQHQHKEPHRRTHRTGEQEIQE